MAAQQEGAATFALQSDDEQDVIGLEQQSGPQQPDLTVAMPCSDDSRMAKHRDPDLSYIRRLGRLTLFAKVSPQPTTVGNYLSYPRE